MIRDGNKGAREPVANPSDQEPTPCPQYAPHQPHWWRAHQDGYEGTVWCPGVAEPVCTQEGAFAAHPITVQDRPPNFRGDDGSLFLVCCFVCSPEYGRENWAMNVAGGVCTWCGWSEDS